MNFDDPADVRYRPDDGCPLFSQGLDDHIVAVTKGQAPNRGRFCGHCYTPLSRGSSHCPHCGAPADASGRTGRRPVEAVPQPIVDALVRQRKVEARWVNGFAYLGVLLAVVSGLAIVLTVPFFRDSLLWATVFYAPYLLLGSRAFAGLLGGYWGDRLGFAKARAVTRAAWEAWVGERDSVSEEKNALEG